MRGTDRLQKLLYLIIVVLGIYILYKGSGLLLKKGEQQGTFDSGKVQRTLEDAAMRTYAPGYTAVVEERENGNWISAWMKQIIPVYSYVADESGRQEGVPETETEHVQAETELSEPGRSAEVERLSETAEQAAEESEVLPETAERVDQKKLSEAESEVMPDPAEAKTVQESTSQKIALQEEYAEAGSEPMQTEEPDAVPASISGISDTLREQLRDFDYLLSNYYIVDEGTSADAKLLDADTLLAQNLQIAQNPEVPQILIYHTHSQETFADSEEGKTEDTIVGMGAVLADELEKCGYNVLHDTGVYDLVDGVLDRSAAYDYARESVQRILEQHPSIEVVIDLHRDGVEGKKFVTEIDGKPASMIMFFNGISRNSNDEPLAWLENPYIKENLAFSLQLQLKAREQYPGFTRNIYLKAERFNLHLRPRSLLIEAGTQLNTVEEERNAMVPLADLLHQVLSGV